MAKHACANCYAATNRFFAHRQYECHRSKNGEKIQKNSRKIRRGVAFATVDKLVLYIETDLAILTLTGDGGIPLSKEIVKYQVLFFLMIIMIVVVIHTIVSVRGQKST